MSPTIFPAFTPEVAADSSGCAAPTVGAVVRVRSRTYVVEGVESAGALYNHAHHVRMACLDDDAQGEILEVVWELELDTEVLDDRFRRDLGRRGFDPAERFGAFLHTLRWHCVTAVLPQLKSAQVGW